jgi:uroporphyrinogen-III synthase
VRARPLSGRHVVTTRDRPGRLDSCLASLGADVIHVPLISIGPPVDGGAALRRVLGSIADFDWVVVTSRHGAARVGDAVAPASSVRLAAVGAGSAAVLAELAGRPVDLVPARQTAADLVEVMRGGSGRVLVAQADRADDTLANGLVELGFDVEVVTAYCTQLRVPTSRERAAALAADAVAFASGSAASAWFDTIGTGTPPVVAVIGPTTAAVAERHGLKVTHVAADQDIDGLVTILAAALT